MLNSSVLKMLSSFTPAEIRNFKEFLRSPFFNKNENVTKIFNYVKKFYPEFNDKKLEKRNIYRHLFGNRKYNDGIMRTLIFNLAKLAEEYLKYTTISKQNLKSGIILLEELNRRKLDKAFMKNFNLLTKENENTEYQNSDYFFNKFLMNTQREIYVNWNVQNKKDIKKLSRYDTKEDYESLTFYYLYNLLREYRYLMYKKTFEPREFKSEFFENILSYLSGRDNVFVKLPLINLHLNEILLQKENSTVRFLILKNILAEKNDHLSHSDRYSLQNILQSFCLRKIFEGDESFIRQRFELFQIALKQKLYFYIEHEYFSEILFGNIVGVGLSLGEFEWVDKFINDYKDLLPPGVKDVVINLSLARFSFAKEQYEEALNHLNKIRSVKNVFLNFTIRNLTLMTYYELNSMTQVRYLIDSYRHFLSKNKKVLVDERFERLNNFLKFFTKLSNLKEKNNDADLFRLHKLISTKTNTGERAWILKKLEELRIN